jgi:hypothetical protein
MVMKTLYRALPLRTFLIAGFVSAVSLSAAPVSAVSVVVGSTPYEVEVFEGPYVGNESLFASISPGKMPWLGNENLAIDFASQVFDQLQGGTTPGNSPLFAFEIIGTDVNGWSSDIVNPNSLYFETFNTGANVKYAIGREVPGPLPFLGVCAGFSFSRRIRQRLKRGQSGH